MLIQLDHFLKFTVTLSITCAIYFLVGIAFGQLYTYLKG